MLKNNKLLTFLVSFVGTGTLLGTGFGAWVFNENGELSLSHSIDGINIEITTEAALGHFADSDLDYEFEKHILVFDEGTNPTDLNDGLSFYTIQNHPVVGAPAPVRDDELEIIFHKDASFEEAKYGLEFQLGAQVQLISDEGCSRPITDFIRINNELFIDNDFVNLTDFFTIGDEFEHNNGQYEGLYVPYTYNMHLNNLFSYTSEDVKPITRDAYIALYNAFKENVFISNPTWHININFEARYVGVNNE